MSLKLLLLVLALLAAALGFVLSMEWFGANPDGNDLWAIIFAALGFYFGSVLSPR